MRVAPLVISGKSKTHNKENRPSSVYFRSERPLFILDNDGTLINTEDLQKKAWQATADKISEDHSTHRIDINEFYGHGQSGNETLAQILERLGIKNSTEEDKVAFRNIKNEYYKDIVNKTSIEQGSDSLLVKGAKQFLQQIKEALPGANFIVASNSVGATHSLKAAGLHDMFNKEMDPITLIDGKDKGILFQKGKPEPDIFLAAAKIYKTAPNDCIVFEDSAEGITAAIKANMRFTIIGANKSEDKLAIGNFLDFTKINVEAFTRKVRIRA